MIINFIYFLIISTFIFLLILTIQAIQRGVKAKNITKTEKSYIKRIKRKN
jgi:large-conductance mechanosensitive channel